MDRRIEEIYTNRRRSAEIDLELRIEKVHLAAPRIVTIKDEIAELYVKLTKARIKGYAENEKSLIDRIDSLKKERDLIFTAAGFDNEFLKLKYVCCTCEDTGYVSTVNGRVKCECLRLEEARLLYKNSNMLSRLNKENFDSFDLLVFDSNKEKGELFSQRENMEDVVSDVKSYIKNFDGVNGKGLVFYGGVGLGKSFLCSCIGKELIVQGKTVLYYSVYDLVKLLSKFTFEKSRYLEAFPFDDYSKLDKVDLLIIDDLGSELTNSFVISELFNIVNSRIVKGKSTIVSTNLDITGIEDRYGERLYSRFLMYFSFYKFIGDDIRRKL